MSMLVGEKKEKGEGRGDRNGGAEELNNVDDCMCVYELNNDSTLNHEVP
jgi:hypothetical protein